MDCHLLLKSGKNLIGIKKTTTNFTWVTRLRKRYLVVYQRAQDSAFLFYVLWNQGKKYLESNSDSMNDYSQIIYVPQFPHCRSKGILIPTLCEWAMDFANLVISFKIFMYIKVQKLLF